METQRDINSSLTESGSFHLTVIIILLVVSSLVASLNILVLVSISCFTNKTYSLNPFICSLSSTEVLQLLGQGVIAASVYFTQGDQGFLELFTLCRVQAWIVIFLRIAASFSVLLIGFDRSLSLINLKYFHLWWRGRLLVLLVSTSWFLSAFLASWPLFQNGSTGPYKDAPHVYCLFSTTSNFALFFAMFHLILFILSFVFIWMMLSSSRRTLISAKFSSSTGKVSVEKRRNLVQEQYSRMRSSMAAAVIAFYCVCMTPFTISVMLGWFSISYPSLYGLVSLQLPLISGLITPLLYGFLWPPYRRAYIRALAAPFVCCRKCTLKKNTRSHNLQAATLSRNASFWSASGLPSNDANQENPFDILFGPSSYNKPLDFQPDELQMFENEGAETSTTTEFDVNSNAYQVQATKICEDVQIENSEQFQSILELIEEMTAGRTKPNCNTEKQTLKRERSKSIDSKTSSAYWSAEKSSITHASEAADMEELKLSFEGDVTSPVEECKERDGAKTHMTGCSCLGKSRCYVVEDNKRFLNYLAAREVQGMVHLGEDVVFLDI